MHNSLPSRMNLDRRGVTIPSTLCPLCLLEEETTNYLLFMCSKSYSIWQECYEWLGDITILPHTVELHFSQHWEVAGNRKSGLITMILG